MLLLMHQLTRHKSLFKDISIGDSIPDKHIELNGFGIVSLVTVGLNTFPKFAWLLKAYDDKTKDPQQRFFNKRMRRVRVVVENAYVMLQGRWRALYKKTDMRNFIMRLVNMVRIMLHNLNDPYEPK